MDWIGKYQPQREQYWPAVEQYWAGLPPQLFRRAVLLKDNLATFYTGSGQFQDLLSRPHDHPLLYWHFWLLDDLGVLETASRGELEKQLFLVMVFTFAGVYTQEIIQDEGSNFDPGYFFLGQALHREAEARLSLLFPVTSIFWDYQRRYWGEVAEASLAGPSPDLAQLPQLIKGKLAFTKLSLAATAIGIDQESLLLPLEPVLDDLNIVLQALRDIVTLRRDLARRIYTYPILRTLSTAGLDPQQALSPAQILGAMVLTGTVAKIGEECLAQLGLCRERAIGLGLPTFAAYCETVEARIQEISTLFSLKKSEKLPAIPTPSRVMFAPAEETLSKVIEMAEGYLLSDLTFRESWEVQRRGVFGTSEMIGRAFPVGLIVEILCRQGHHLAAPLETVFEILHRTGCRYYDHTHLPPDTDDLALLLRLYPYTSQPELHREMLQAPLAWLQAAISPAGEIPVWLINPETTAQYTQVALWGNQCVAVEANLLLGLAAYDEPGYRPLIDQALTRLEARWSSRGFSATAHYVPLYSLWVTLELVAKLTTLEDPTLAPSLTRLGETLLALLAREAERPFLSPQDTAFLTLSCLVPIAGLEEKLQALLKPDWPVRLYKSQRYDGSWAGEPLYGTPTRGEFAAWYSSRTMTTAFCYHALKQYQATHPPA